MLAKNYNSPFTENVNLSLKTTENVRDFTIRSTVQMSQLPEVQRRFWITPNLKKSHQNAVACSSGAL
jgi:hypothetical protein